MAYKTLETILAPDGRLGLTPEDLPTHSVRVMVTMLEDSDSGEALSELGDYHDRLTDYEDRLARGEIQWR